MLSVISFASPASAAGDANYELPDYAPTFEVVENQCANVMTGDVAAVRCWTENGTDMIMRLRVTSPRYKNTTRLRVQKTSVLVATQGTDEAVSGWLGSRTYTFLEPAGYDGDGFPFFLFSMEKWATQAVEVALMPSERALTINFNVNRGSLSEPVVLREADSKQGNYWRLSKPLQIVDKVPGDETNTITFEATAEDAADAANVVGVAFFRADPVTYLYDDVPTASTVVGMTGRYPFKDAVVCPSDACTRSIDTTTGTITWRAQIPASWSRLQYIMDVTGTEATHPYRARRAYQGQLTVPEPTVVPMPATPQVDDPCGPGNASWLVPEDTDELSWRLDGESGELAVGVRGDAIFDDGTTTHSFGVPSDSGEECPVVIETANPPRPEPDPSQEPSPMPEATPASTPTSSATGTAFPVRGLARTGVDGRLLLVAMALVPMCGYAVMLLARRRGR